VPIRMSKYFFLIIFLGFFASNTFFDHAHIYDGSIIVHSHPFKPDREGKPAHNHSERSYVLVYCLNTIIANVILVFSLFSFFYTALQRITPETIVNFRSENYRYLFHLRGPPSDIQL